MPGDTGVAPVADPYARVAWSNRSTEQNITDKGVAAQIDWISPWFGGATLTSITSFRDWTSMNGLDFDFSTADLLFRNPAPYGELHRLKDAEEKLQQVKALALEELSDKAKALGADGIVGVTVTFTNLDTVCCLCSAVGTAIRIA